MPSGRLSAVVVLAIAAGVVAWLLVRGDDNSKSSRRATAQAVSAKDLTALPATVHHPVYWAGPKPGFTYELTRTSSGLIFIRYLPNGVPLGTNQPRYLTIGTYPVKNAFAAVRAIAKRSGTPPMSISGGGIAVQDATHPTSVYLAYPGSDYQIEVFDPSPTAARRTAVSGAIVALGPGAGPSQVSAAVPRATTLAGLRSFSSLVGHSVYWAGPIPGTRLELTHTNDDRIYIRYLPKGVKIGDRGLYLTVGTYPVRNAFAAVQAIAKRPGARRIRVPGAVAVVDPIHPTSVYVAFRGSKYQLEVFDRSVARARQIVASGKIVPVP
jgi:hypothetical protein